MGRRQSDLEEPTYVVKKRRRRRFGSVGAAHGSVAAGGGSRGGQLIGWSGWVSALALLFLSGTQTAFGQHNLQTEHRVDIQDGDTVSAKAQGEYGSARV